MARKGAILETACDNSKTLLIRWRLHIYWLIRTCTTHRQQLSIYIHISKKIQQGSHKYVIIDRVENN